MRRLLALVERLSRAQRRELVEKLKAQATATESIELVESPGRAPRGCPHGGGHQVVRNGVADGLQRYKCRACGKTFNALTGTPLARLRHKGKWLEQARAIADGLTVHRAAEHLGVAPSTAFRWRHRFLAVPRGVKPVALAGVAEIDETLYLEPVAIRYRHMRPGQHERDLRRTPSAPGTSRTSIRTTDASSSGCAASTASPPLTWRTTSVGSAPWSGRIEPPRNPRNCSAWPSARSAINS